MSSLTSLATAPNLIDLRTFLQQLGYIVDGLTPIVVNDADRALLIQKIKDKNVGIVEFFLGATAPGRPIAPLSVKLLQTIGRYLANVVYVASKLDKATFSSQQLDSMSQTNKGAIYVSFKEGLILGQESLLDTKTRALVQDAKSFNDYAVGAVLADDPNKNIPPATIELVKAISASRQTLISYLANKLKSLIARSEKPANDETVSLGSPSLVTAGTGNDAKYVAVAQEAVKLINGAIDSKKSNAALLDRVGQFRNALEQVFGRLIPRPDRDTADRQLYVDALLQNAHSDIITRDLTESIQEDKVDDWVRLNWEILSSSADAALIRASALTLLIWSAPLNPETKPKDLTETFQPVSKNTKAGMTLISVWYILQGEKDKLGLHVAPELAVIEKRLGAGLYRRLNGAFNTLGSIPLRRVAAFGESGTLGSRSSAESSPSTSTLGTEQERKRQESAELKERAREQERKQDEEKRERERQREELERVRQEAQERKERENEAKAKAEDESKAKALAKPAPKAPKAPTTLSRQDLQLPKPVSVPVNTPDVLPGVLEPSGSSSGSSRRAAMDVDQQGYGSSPVSFASSKDDKASTSREEKEKEKEEPKARPSTQSWQTELKNKSERELANLNQQGSSLSDINQAAINNAKELTEVAEKLSTEKRLFSELKIRQDTEVAKKMAKADEKERDLVERVNAFLTRENNLKEAEAKFASTRAEEEATYKARMAQLVTIDKKRVQVHEDAMAILEQERVKAAEAKQTSDLMIQNYDKLIQSYSTSLGGGTPEEVKARAAELKQREANIAKLETEAKSRISKLEAQAKTRADEMVKSADVKMTAANSKQQKVEADYEANATERKAIEILQQSVAERQAELTHRETELKKWEADSKIGEAEFKTASTNLTRDRAQFEEIKTAAEAEFVKTSNIQQAARQELEDMYKNSETSRAGISAQLALLPGITSASTGSGSGSGSASAARPSLVSEPPVSISPIAFTVSSKPVAPASSPVPSTPLPGRETLSIDTSAVSRLKRKRQNESSEEPVEPAEGTKKAKTGTESKSRKKVEGDETESDTEEVVVRRKAKVQSDIAEAKAVASAKAVAAASTESKAKKRKRDTESDAEKEKESGSSASDESEQEENQDETDKDLAQDKDVSYGVPETKSSRDELVQVFEKYIENADTKTVLVTKDKTLNYTSVARALGVPDPKKCTLFIQKKENQAHDNEVEGHKGDVKQHMTKAEAGKAPYCATLAGVRPMIKFMAYPDLLPKAGRADRTRGFLLVGPYEDQELKETLKKYANTLWTYRDFFVDYFHGLMNGDKASTGKKKTRAKKAKTVKSSSDEDEDEAKSGEGEGESDPEKASSEEDEGESSGKEEKKTKQKPNKTAKSGKENKKNQVKEIDLTEDSEPQEQDTEGDVTMNVIVSSTLQAFVNYMDKAIRSELEPDAVKYNSSTATFILATWDKTVRPQLERLTDKLERQIDLPDLETKVTMWPKNAAGVVIERNVLVAGAIDESTNKQTWSEPPDWKEGDVSRYDYLLVSPESLLGAALLYSGETRKFATDVDRREALGIFAKAMWPSLVVELAKERGPETRQVIDRVWNERQRIEILQLLEDIGQVLGFSKKSPVDPFIVEVAMFAITALDWETQASQDKAAPKTWHFSSAPTDASSLVLQKQLRAIVARRLNDGVPHYRLLFAEGLRLVYLWLKKAEARLSFNATKAFKKIDTSASTSLAQATNISVFTLESKTVKGTPVSFVLEFDNSKKSEDQKWSVSITPGQVFNTSRSILNILSSDRGFWAMWSSILLLNPRMSDTITKALGIVVQGKTATTTSASGSAALASSSGSKANAGSSSGSATNTLESKRAELVDKPKQPETAVNPSGYNQEQPSLSGMQRMKDGKWLLQIVYEELKKIDPASSSKLHGALWGFTTAKPTVFFSYDEKSTLDMLDVKLPPAVYNKSDQGNYLVFTLRRQAGVYVFTPGPLSGDDSVKNILSSKILTTVNDFGEPLPQSLIRWRTAWRLFILAFKKSPSAFSESTLSQ